MRRLNRILDYFCGTISFPEFFQLLPQTFQRVILHLQCDTTDKKERRRGLLSNYEIISIKKTLRNLGIQFSHELNSTLPWRRRHVYQIGDENNIIVFLISIEYTLFRLDRQHLE